MPISPELVPHTEFHRGLWLRSPSPAGWYYFLRTPNPNTICAASFLDTVDRPLRKLVRMLHEQGIRTTPSCAGHCLSRRALGEIYESILDDAERVRCSGLALTEIQTGAVYRFRDPRYSLPWSKREFIERTYRYQRKGVLGIRPGHRRRLADRLMSLQIPDLEIERSGGVIVLHTHGHRTGANGPLWRRVTGEIEELLEAA